MVDRHSSFESKGITKYKMSLFNNTMARILLRMIPNFNESYQRFNPAYLSKIVHINVSYLKEVLDFLLDKDIVSFSDGEYYISQDNLWRIQEGLNRQSIVLLLRRIDEVV